ncbi:hypothetical protein CG435_17445 [Pantoea ananatis]|nr:hypothetical protein CG435_17445 [Pantoea ananatis]
MMNKPIVATGTGKRILRIVGMAGELADAMDNISLSLSTQAGHFSGQCCRLARWMLPRKRTLYLSKNPLQSRNLNLSRCTLW